MGIGTVMFKTNFWTDAKVDERFTPEDKYFYLWCITNPHTNILGCFEVGKKSIARQLGYNSEDNNVVNALLTRFKNVFNLVEYDEITNELLVKNAWKHNWNSSPTCHAMIQKALKKVKSEKFLNYLVAKCAEASVQLGLEYAERLEKARKTTPTDTGCGHPVHTPIEVEVDNKYILQNDIVILFDYIYKEYPRRIAKVQALKTFTNKVSGLNKEDATNKARQIYSLMKERKAKEWASRDEDKIPHMSTWLNQEVPDKKKPTGGK